MKRDQEPLVDSFGWQSWLSSQQSQHQFETHVNGSSWKWIFQASQLSWFPMSWGAKVSHPAEPSLHSWLTKLWAIKIILIHEDWELLCDVAEYNISQWIFFCFLGYWVIFFYHCKIIMSLHFTDNGKYCPSLVAPTQFQLGIMQCVSSLKCAISRQHRRILDCQI